MGTKDRALNSNELVVLLAVMRVGSDAYGVSIREEIEKRTTRRMAFGVLYPILSRLERDGMLRSHEGESTPERGGRAKKYFTITGLGLRAVSVALNDFESLQTDRVSGEAHA